MIFNMLLVLVTFLAMEGVAWVTHKYIMHGFMWHWHKSHHTYHKDVLEKNDLFAVVFSFSAMGLVLISALFSELYFLFYIALGITAYGVSYFIFHDVLVHRRIKIKFQAKNSYLKRIMRAHYAHHKYHTREGGEAFGFLYAPAKYDESNLREAEAGVKEELGIEN